MRGALAILIISMTSHSGFGETKTANPFVPLVNISGVSAKLPGVKGVAVDAAGNVFFASGGYSAYSVLRLDSGTGMLTSVAGNGTPGFSGDNGPATSAQLNGAIDVQANGPNRDRRAHRLCLALCANCFYYERTANNDSGQGAGGSSFGGAAPGKVGVHQINLALLPDITTGVQPLMEESQTLRHPFEFVGERRFARSASEGHAIAMKLSTLHSTLELGRIIKG